jgi:excisionase family DNA binding protein
MKPATYRAITAILETDTSIPGAQKQAIQRACEGLEPVPHPPTRERPQFVTPREAAEILCTSTRTIWRLLRIGKLQRIKLGHRSTRIRLADIANITSVEDNEPMTNGGIAN